MNKQSIRAYKKRPQRQPKELAPVKSKGKHISKKVSYQGIDFDSMTEMHFYRHLMADPAVKEVIVHPVYEILPAFKVACKKCMGAGGRRNEKTGNVNKCQRCKGSGQFMKQPSVYTPDFHVTYIDGYEEVVDVKGHKKTDNEGFPLRKRLFEYLTRKELIVVRLDKKTGDWKRDIQ